MELWERSLYLAEEEAAILCSKQPLVSPSNFIYYSPKLQRSFPRSNVSILLHTQLSSPFYRFELGVAAAAKHNTRALRRERAPRIAQAVFTV